MRQFLLLFGGLHFTLLLQAQDTLRLSRADAETLFLQNNLLLLSEKLHIETQQAEVIQAKAWPNPQFSIDEVNLWQNKGVEPSPPFWGNFGRNQQVAFQLDQLVQTAGKRKKLVAMEEVEVAKAAQYFEELLRALKLELRNQLTELQFLQQSISVHQNLRAHVAKLTTAYKHQLDGGNIPKAAYIRLKAEELEINQAILGLTQQAYEIQKDLKILLRTNPSTTIEITDDGHTNVNDGDGNYPTEKTIGKALENRPDYRLAELDVEYADKLIAYEKAQRIPDLTFGVGYDRNGSTMLDFVGIGVSFDLPIFNHNKGGIKKSRIQKEQSTVQKEQTALTIRNEIHLAYQSLQQAVSFLDQIEADYEDELEQLLNNYTRNFMERNVDMVTFLDFMDAYLTNKSSILEAQKEVRQKSEELNYALGNN